MTTVDLLIITDGRTEYLRKAVDSAAANLDQDLIHERWMYDDTGDADHRAMLRTEYPDFRHFDAGPRQGFGGAIRAAWAHLLAHSTADMIFHLEQDFTFNRWVPLVSMAFTLEDHPHLVQLALRRQPWNQSEADSGGIIEQHPDDYEECVGTYGIWLEHRRFFTTNPCLYRRDLMLRGWPTGQHSEGHFGISLFSDPAVRAAFWGARDGGEAVEHIGHQRIGAGY